MIRVLIIDDHAAIREAMMGILEACPGITVIGEGATGEEAIRLARQLGPDVILMDVAIPLLDGIEAIRRITEEHPHIIIVGLSVHPGPSMEFALKDAGAVVLIVKETANGPSLRYPHQALAGAETVRLKREIR